MTRLYAHILFTLADCLGNLAISLERKADKLLLSEVRGSWARHGRGL